MMVASERLLLSFADTYTALQPGSITHKVLIIVVLSITV
jgi:hypothetical protein